MVRPARRRLMRSLGIIGLILGVLHVPLPQPDYHSISHHDDCVGEVCALHNHLLRWHSGATTDDEQAVFHWHWAWPGRSAGEHESDTDGSGQPVLHADSNDTVEPTLEAVPPFLPGRARLAGFAPEFAAPIDLFALVEPIAPTSARRCLGPHAPHLIARTANLAATLQRWDC